MTHRRSITWKSAPRIAASKDSPAKYPKIFRDRHGSMTETAMCWGFDIGDGWYHLVDALCEELQRETDQGGPQVVATQVKEKYGGLRFYVDASNDRQSAMIDFAEALSLRTCETCGAPGTLGESKTGWLATRCEAHRDPGKQQP